MSTISIRVLGGSKSTTIVRAVRSLTRASVGKVTQALEIEAPVFEREIFDNQIEETFALIRNLLDRFEELGLSLAIEEDGVAISPETLRNIMSSSEEVGAEIRRLDDIGHV